MNSLLCRKNLVNFQITEVNCCMKSRFSFLLAKEVDTHKMMAIGVKNLLKTISKQRQTEQRDLQVIQNFTY